MRPCDLFISLGSNCEVSYNIRRFFGFEAAYPFDWWITPLSPVPKLIESDFALELTTENLQSLATTNP